MDSQAIDEHEPPRWLEDEFDVCARCGRKRLSPPSVGVRVCLHCGDISDASEQSRA
jgi:hypothetical protein